MLLKKTVKLHLAQPSVPASMGGGKWGRGRGGRGTSRRKSIAHRPKADRDGTVDFEEYHGFHGLMIKFTRGNCIGIASKIEAWVGRSDERSDQSPVCKPH